MDYSSGLLGPGCYWCLPPSISAPCAAWLPCNSAWSVGCTLLSLLRIHCGIKGFALCGVLSPSTPLWNGLVSLCSAALRYSSLMFQDPHGTSGKALEYPSGSRVPFLPLSFAASWLLLLLPLCGVSLCLCLVLPLLLCPLSALPLRPRLLLDLVVTGCSPLMLKFGYSCDLSCCSGARIHCLRVEFALNFAGAAMSFLSFCGFSPPCFLLCVSLVVCPLAFCWCGRWLVCCWASLFVWVGEIGPGPEPWTGLHCSELYWR